MRVVRGCVAAAIVLVLASSVSADTQEAAKKQLLGTWVTRQKIADKELTAQLTFEEDNDLILKVLGADMDFTFKGKYKVVDGRTIEATILIEDVRRSESWTFTVTRDTLKLTDMTDKEKGGTTRTYTRVK